LHDSRGAIEEGREVNVSRSSRLIELQARAADCVLREREALKALDAIQAELRKAEQEAEDYATWCKASTAARNTALALTEEQLAVIRGVHIGDVARVLSRTEWAEGAKLIKWSRLGYGSHRPELTILGNLAVIVAQRGREWGS